MKTAGPGLLAGCKILTIEGYTSIADLKPGARVVTRSGLKRLRHLNKTTRFFKPVAVTSGSLGYTRPARNLKMAPDQEVMVRDWRAEVLFGRDAVVIPVSRLLDGKYIFSQGEAAHHDVYELVFDIEEVFYADGVELLSKHPTATSKEDHLTEAA
ncbi:MAG: Hint domain-containing protein [Pseudomonadota bacterium]